jgi:hypothetical protein
MINNNGKDFWASSVELPDDPHTEQRPDLRHSQTAKNALKPPPQVLGEKGFITDVYPATHSYTVEASVSGTLKGVQRIAQSPGDKAMLPVGTLVAVTHAYGPPLIAGVLMHGTPVADEKTPHSITGVEGFGADDPIYGEKGNANFRSEGAPRDLSPNDWAQVGAMGNVVAMLDGGVNVIKSTDFSQIRTHLVNDVVEIISQRFRHMHSMGFSEIQDEGGRTSFVFRGGSDQTTECGSDQENWTIRFDLGTSGDLFKFELTQPDGASVFRIHVTPDGKADMFAAKGFNWSGGEDRTDKNLSNEVTEVKGNVQRTVGGEELRDVRGARKTNVSSNDAKNVGNDAVESIMRHFTRSVGGQAKYKFVGGNPATATPINEALGFEIVNGSWKVNIGDPISGGSPAALAGFDLGVSTGNIDMAIKKAGNIDFSTLLGNASLKTKVGLATLKTGVGIANVDGTTVNLGPAAAAFANPLIKGTIHTTALGAYLTANTAAFSTMTGATTALITALTAPVVPMLTWILASPLIVVWLNIINATFAAMIASNAALMAALPTTLSTKSFTA